MVPNLLVGRTLSPPYARRYPTKVPEHISPIEMTMNIRLPKNDTRLSDIGVGMHNALRTQDLDT